MCVIEELELDIHRAAGSMLRRQTGSRQPICERRFRSLFGVSPNLVPLLWAEREDRPDETVPTHLLWALMFLKVYATESVHAAIAGVDEKTFRK